MTTLVTLIEEPLIILEKEKGFRWKIHNQISLKIFEHEVSRAINFWVKSTKEGYIVEFVVELTNISHK
jgi:hypothetical protein